MSIPPQKQDAAATELRISKKRGRIGLFFYI